MADRRTTLLQCSLRIRRRRKWKTRWCTLTKLSPISDQVILRLYKNREAVESSRELSREQISISAQNFCGLSLAYRYSKNPYVLTVVCLDFVVLLSFESHGELLSWYHKIQNTLPSAAEFQTRVIVPNQPSKIHPGQAILHFYDNHFALTPAIPKELIGSWSLSSLQKYTFVGDSVFFSATTSKGEKTFVLVTKDVTVAENLKIHFDLATSVHPLGQGGQQPHLPPTPEHSRSHQTNAGDSNYQNSAHGGSNGYHGDPPAYGTYNLPPPPPPPPESAHIRRANSCGSQASSFESRRQDDHDDYTRMRSHNPLELHGDYMMVRSQDSLEQDDDYTRMRSHDPLEKHEDYTRVRSQDSLEQADDYTGMRGLEHLERHGDYTRMRSHDPLDPTASEPLLQGTTGRSKSVPTLPLQDLACSPLVSEVRTPGGNGEEVFGFWEPSTPQSCDRVSKGTVAPSTPTTTTTFLYECMPEADLQASAALQQNYEVMNTFDHIRRRMEEAPVRAWSSEDSSTITGCSNCSDGQADLTPDRPHLPDRPLPPDGRPIPAGTSNNRSEASCWEEGSYMNLFTRRTAGGDLVPARTPPLPPIFIPHPGRVDNSISPRPLPHVPFPGSHHGSSRALEMIECEPAASAAMDIPAPFDHCFLVQPTGPIAMLTLEGALDADNGGASPPSTVSRTGSSAGGSATKQGGACPKAISASATLPWGRTKSCPADSSTWKTLQSHRKYSMPPSPGNLLPDTRQAAARICSNDVPPELPPRVPPREPFLPSSPSPHIRQRCYTDSALSGDHGPATSHRHSDLGEQQGRYLLMKPSYEEKLQAATYRRSLSVSASSSPADVAIPTSPLGFISRVYNNPTLGPLDHRSPSPSLVRSNKAKMDGGRRYLKRSATVATNLTRQGGSSLTLSIARSSNNSANSGDGEGVRRGSMGLTDHPHSLPRRSYSTASAVHLSRPRTSRDYASINPAAIITARKSSAPTVRSSSSGNISPPAERLFAFSDTSGSGLDMSSSSLSDLSSQASHSRASSFGSQSGVVLRRRHTSGDLKEEGALDGVTGAR